MSKLDKFWGSTQISITNVETGVVLSGSVDALRKHFKFKACNKIVDILKYGCGSGSLRDWRLVK